MRRRGDRVHGAGPPFRVPVLLAAMLATMLALSAGGAPAQTAAAQPTPGDVAAAIREAVKLQPPTLLEGAELAPLRATSGPQLGDAVTCLRLAGAPPVYIAVFFDHGKVLS